MDDRSSVKDSFYSDNGNATDLEKAGLSPCIQVDRLFFSEDCFHWLTLRDDADVSPPRLSLLSSVC